VHTLALFFGMLSVLFLKKGENLDRKYFFFLSGIVLGLSLLTRFTYLIFIFIFGLNYLLFFKKYKFASIFSLGLGFLICVLPYLIWAQIRFGDLFYTFKNARLVTDWSSHQPWNFYFLHPIIFLSFIGMVGIGLWLFFKVKEKSISKNEIFLIVLFLFPFIYLSLMPHKELRFLIITLISVILLSALGFSKFSHYLKNKGLFTFILIILLFVSVFTFNYSPYPRQCNSDVEFVSNWINSNAHINDTIYVQDFYPYFGYYTKNRVIIAPLARERFFNISSSFNETGYFIYFQAQNNLSNFPSLSELKEDNRFNLTTELKNKESIYIFKVR
jgi:4-amino-4-deoxy-L-arabinose transferase-like glycosyltransferase